MGWPRFVSAPPEISPTSLQKRLPTTGSACRQESSKTSAQDSPLGTTLAKGTDVIGGTRLEKHVIEPRESTPPLCVCPGCTGGVAIPTLSTAP
jgi:hypothetical protein